MDTTKEPYKTALLSIVAALAAQMKSVNSTFQSVVYKGVDIIWDHL